MTAILNNKPAQGFKELLTFPAVIDFRIIIDALELDGLKKLQQELTKLAGAQDYAVQGEPRVSANGKYISYTLRASVHSAEELNGIYTGLGKISYVKHVL